MGIGEVAAPATSGCQFSSHAWIGIDQQDLRLLLAGFKGCHDPGWTGADNGYFHKG